MLNINKETAQSTLTIYLSGRLDTGSAPQLDAELKASLEGVTNLIFDFKELEYTSSAGLRVLLHARKSVSGKGGMTVRNANEDILEIFDITGIKDLITIE